MTIFICTSFFFHFVLFFDCRVANLWRSFTKNGTMAAESPKLVYRILTYCRLLEASGRGAFSLQSRPDTTTGLDAVIEELSTSHRTLYFAFASGKKNAFKPLSSLYDSPNLNYVVTNTTRIAPTTGLWDLVNLFLGSARQVAQVRHSPFLLFIVFL